ncbi:hypothetical protein JXJ21_15640 [candidate division KSB1 bacterium]|nr:hypothetical protein [candidate division KSB1 bacterium]
MKVPLITDSYPISELIENNDFISADSNGADENVYINIEKEINRFEMYGRLKTDPLIETFNSELGSFDVEAPGRQSTGFTLSDINSELDQFDGQTMVVPEFEIESEMIPLPEFGNFEWVIIDSGRATVTLTNQTALTLGKPMIVTLFDMQSGNEIGSIIYDQEIAPGDSATSFLDLAGKTLTRILNVKLSGASAGSNDEMVDVDLNQKAYVGTDIGLLKVSAAAAKIPRQRVKRENEIVLNDSIQVDSAQIRDGYMEINVGMTFPLPGTIIFEIPGISDTQNRILRDSVRVSAAQDIRMHIDLDGYMLNLDLNDTGNQILKLRTWYINDGTGDAMVALNSSDEIWSQIELSEIHFNYLKGEISIIKVSIDPLSEDLDIPSGLDSLSLTLLDAELRLDINSRINFPAQLDMAIEGATASGSIIPLYLNENLDAAENYGELQTTQIVLNSDNSNIVQFINALPGEIYVSGTVHIGRDNWVGKISEDDYVEGTLTITSPLSFILPTQEIETKIDTIELEQDVRERIARHGKSGFIYGTVSNHFPFETQLQIALRTVDSLVYSQPEVVLGPVTIQSGNIDPNTGYVSSASLSEIQLEMSEQQIQIFDNPKLYAGILLDLPGSDGNTIKANRSDYLSLSIGARLLIKIDLTDDEDGL